MSRHQQTESAVSNQQLTAPTCWHCAGVASHETWCITCNAVVRYAYEIVSDTYRVTIGDQLILHALGVAWSGSASNKAK